MLHVSVKDMEWTCPLRVVTKEIVNVRVDEEDLRRIDLAVRKGAFASRSDAIRVMVARFLREHPEAFEDPALQALWEQPPVADEVFERLAARAFQGPKTAAEIVAEGRERS